MRLPLLTAALFTLLAVGGAAAIVAQGSDEPEALRVVLRNVNGAAVGTADLKAASRLAPVDVRVSVRRLQPGFHGFHVHAIGRCEAPGFTTAAGHLKADGTSHGSHRGDMPSLLVKRNGTATLRFTTDGFSIADLGDADGSAIMVHAGADNFANIPPRYAPTGADQQTKDTGDTGPRVVCGSVAAAG